MFIQKYKIVLSDFSGVILNKNRFTNVHFKKCVFYAAIFRDCRFKNCTFEKCIFINTNTESLNHSILDCSKKYNFYEMKIPDDLKDQLTEYRNIPILQKNRLLHLKGEESIPQPYSFSYPKYPNTSC